MFGAAFLVRPVGGSPWARSATNTEGSALQHGNSDERRDGRHRTAADVRDGRVARDVPARALPARAGPVRRGPAHGRAGVPRRECAARPRAPFRFARVRVGATPARCSAASPWPSCRRARARTPSPATAGAIPSCCPRFWGRGGYYVQSYAEESPEYLAVVKGRRRRTRATTTGRGGASSSSSRPARCAAGRGRRAPSTPSSARGRRSPRSTAGA